MAGLFSRLKVWVGLEVIQNADLNAEFDNIINNLGPAGMSGWSASIAQMQIQTSPGGVGSESLPTSLNGEIERLRFQLNAIIGGPDNLWYDPVTASLSSISKSLGTVSGSTYPNRIVSGAVSATSQQANFLYPSGSTNSVTLKATATGFFYEINGTQYSVLADTTLTGLAKAPASANTANLKDVLQAGADITKITGEGGSYLRLSSVGSNIISASPYLGAFKIVDSATTEYLVGWVTTLSSALTPTSVFPIGATTILVSSVAGLMVGQLITDTTTSGNFAANTYITAIEGLYITLSAATLAASATIPGDTLNVAANTGFINQAFRGYFYNSTGVPIPRTVVNNSDTLTVMQPTWIFINTAGTLIGSTIQPRYDGNTPITGTSSQYWYDIYNQTWKQYNGVSWVVANVTLIGMAITDSSNTVGARSFDFYASYSSQAAMRLIQQDVNTIINEAPRSEVSVNGNLFQYQHDDLQFVKPTDIEAGQSLAANGNAYLYVTEQGHSIISPIYPYDRTFDLRGWYHPYNSWRCVGYAVMDATPNFQTGLGSDYNGFVRTYSAYNNKNLGYGSVGKDELMDFSVTPTKLSKRQVGTNVGVGGLGISASCGLFAVTYTGAFVPVTNMSVTITTTGRPVMLMVQNDGSGNESNYGATASPQSIAFAFYRGASQISYNNENVFSTTTTATKMLSYQYVDTPAAGTYTYTFQLYEQINNGAINMQYYCLVAYEL